MVDIVSTERRSANMSRIRGKDTGPEIAVRSLLHRLGLRFRLHDKRLPGRPDLVLRRHRTVVFVHGCFWHRHLGCPQATTPSSNAEFWARKFSRNVERDQAVTNELQLAGWRVVVIWECELKNLPALTRRMQLVFLRADHATPLASQGHWHATNLRQNHSYSTEL